ncbi:MAG: hypothetical protein ACOCUL_04270 [Bacteroidota bacterium]
MRKMVKNYIIIISIIIINSFSNKAFLQEYYHTDQSEMIFSFGTFEKDNRDIPVNLRYTSWLHLSRHYHFNINNWLGFYSGMALRNIGIISFEDYAENELSLLPGLGPYSTIKTKRRSYSLGIPLAFKLGSFKKHVFFYGGGSYELLFHYKQKVFIEGNKYKETKWFSKKTNTFIPSVFAGIQFPKGLNFSFKWYLDNFLNQNYAYKGIKPYAGVDTQIFYVSISFQYSTSKKYKKKKKEENTGKEKEITAKLSY